MSIAEFTSTAPQESALGAFWRNIRGARSRPQSASPKAWLRRDRALEAPGFTDRVPDSPRPRLRITAERLMNSYFSTLTAGAYPYRDLKTAFDGLCEEAEVDAVTDKRFAIWLQDRGAVRQRVNTARVTMYRIGLPPLPRKGKKAAKRRATTKPSMHRQAMGGRTRASSGEL